LSSERAEFRESIRRKRIRRRPQGDVIRIFNHVRLVRNLDPSAVRLVLPDLTPLTTAARQRPMGPARGERPECSSKENRLAWPGRDLRAYGKGESHDFA